jgi:hypothetical protein
MDPSLQGTLHPARLWNTMTISQMAIDSEIMGPVGGTTTTNWGAGVQPRAARDFLVQAQVALWAVPVVLVLGGVAGWFAGKRWG